MKTFKQYLREKVNISELVPEVLVRYLCAGTTRKMDCLNKTKTLTSRAEAIFKYRDKHFIVFLKFVRFYMLRSLMNYMEKIPELYGTSDDEILKFISKYYDRWYVETEWVSRIPEEALDYLDNILPLFEHYYSLNLPDIENFNPPSNMSLTSLLDKFDEFEVKWKQETKDLIPDSLRKEQGWKTIIKFSNGWEWMDLGRASCEFEGNSMGHCGNSPNARNSNQTIFSLREPKNGGKYWEPHLTFIYWKQEQSLGEMKGRGNDKPSEKYHDYIIKLL